MVGRMVLFALICFAAYWAWQFYKAGKKAKEDKKKEADLGNLYGHRPRNAGESQVDNLIADFKQKIADIESKSAEEIKIAEELLNHYKSELEKLNNLKNK